MAVGFPPRAQPAEHDRRDRHKPVFAALAGAEVDPRKPRLTSAEIAHLQVDRLADAQPSGVDQTRDDPEAIFAQHRPEPGDLRAGEHRRQFSRGRRTHQFEQPPLVTGEVAVEVVQRRDGRPH